MINTNVILGEDDWEALNKIQLEQAFTNLTRPGPGGSRVEKCVKRLFSSEDIRDVRVEEPYAVKVNVGKQGVEFKIRVGIMNKKFSNRKLKVDNMELILPKGMYGGPKVIVIVKCLYLANPSPYDKLGSDEAIIFNIIRAMV